MKNLSFILIFLLSSSVLAAGDLTASLNFFVDSSLAPQVGLSCNSESECKEMCDNSKNCQKPVTTCLNCSGARSPYMMDFFNNVGDLTTACFDQGISPSQAESLFKSVNMIPIFPISSYNPLGLKDFGQTLKFMSLCPPGTVEPVVIGFADQSTNSVNKIDLVKCNQGIFPLVKLGEDCAEKADKVLAYIREQEEKQLDLKTSYENEISLGDTLPLGYDVLQFSEYSEGQYIRCTRDSAAICQSICHSSLSCTIPLRNQLTAQGITAFNKGQYRTCGIERFSAETLVSYLNYDDSFSFNSLSLSQSYDISDTSVSFTDLTVIDAILQTYSGIFKAIDNTEDSSFFISDAYQMRIETKMKSFCDPLSDPFIIGHKGQVERVFCRSGQNGYFQVLANHGESCSDKIAKLLTSNVGATDEK